MSQTFTFINKSGRLYGQTQVYAGAVFGFDITAEHAPVFTLDVDRKGVFIKDIFYGGASMVGVLRGGEQSRVEFSGLGVKSKGERLSFGYTWLFTYGKNSRYTWRMDRKSREALFLEDNLTSRMSASFKRTSDDEKLEGRLTIGITPDLPMLMLIMMTLKLSLVRLQASDAKVAFGIVEPGAVEAELERLEAVKAAGTAGSVALNGSRVLSPAAAESETALGAPESSRSSTNGSVNSAYNKGWFQRKFKANKNYEKK
ncbi:hypothetical protein J3B02_001691 [Coemansia erecta]|uniref:Uncharacterized protein n=1 Tax=Coemansia asiatica TaxID=1052880 RepID=A0A9W7XGI2_9FUNG|nr:hypothetical protein LPJ64_004228 [Coemansia asiatica]KAJ2856268.1 hypothetical protein J3B02_001691 [Coemansia erecta]KAJ2861837.1 hypothetical protein FB639_005458 [Coemansia asiatica]